MNIRKYLMIKYKWLKDSRRLPLTKAHWDIYYIIHELCYKELKEFPELVNCRDFNDRIQWLKLFDQDRELIRCSDKILVRDYVKEQVGEQYLIKLYQVRDHFKQIDFGELPSSFVIKTNHDSGSVILVRDKKCLDRHKAEAYIEKALSRPYGWQNGEWAYSYIQPKVLVEEFIAPEDNHPPPDYKFQCVDGRVKFCRFTYDRGVNTKEIVVDRDGNDLGFILDENFQQGFGFVLPPKWGEMVFVAEQLSMDFKCVRVDMYFVNNEIFIGELTFFPLMGCYKGEGQKLLGQLLDFDRTTFKPFLLPELEAERSRFSLYQCENCDN